jgi:RimJ/RimL family protein N-acetyltransferase
MTIAPTDFIFDTGRLHVRPIGEGDEALYSGLYTDPETMRWISPPLTVDEAARCFHAAVASMSRRPLAALHLAILERETSLPLGLCGVQEFDSCATRLELGSILLARARGSGFAREAKAGLIGRLFSLLPVDEICLEYQRGNVAALRSNLSIGFSPEVSVIPDGQTIEWCRMSVHRNAWYCLSGNS